MDKIIDEKIRFNLNLFTSCLISTKFNMLLIAKFIKEKTIDIITISGISRVFIGLFVKKEKSHISFMNLDIYNQLFFIISVTIILYFFLIIFEYIENKEHFDNLINYDSKNRRYNKIYSLIYKDEHIHNSGIKIFSFILIIIIPLSFFFIPLTFETFFDGIKNYFNGK